VTVNFLTVTLQSNC